MRDDAIRDRVPAGDAGLPALALVLVFVILAAGIVGAGYLYFRNYEENYRNEVGRQLSAIADLKASELVQYRTERLGDASILFRNTVFSETVQRFLDNPADGEAQRQLREWLGKIQSHNQYDQIRLLDVRGASRMAIPAARPPVSSVIARRVPEILRSGEVTFEDFYRNEHDQRPYLALLVPVYGGKDKHRAIAVLLFRIDPETYLYPFLRRWPIPSRTAETLLLRRDGNDVLFLNELKFRKNTALHLRIPLEEGSTMPAVNAVLGREGIVEGVDYRGVPVLADVRAVPGSPWFLVSRMDRTEVYAPVRERLWWLVVLVSVLLLGAAAGVGMAWRQQRVRFYRERYEAAESLHESESRWHMLVDGVKDHAIFLLDAGGHVLNWNAGAERMKGYRSDEVVGQHYSRFFTREDQQENKPQLLLAAAESLGRTEEEGWRIRKDGSRFWADAVITVLRKEDGSLYGFAKITRDLTERRKAEEKLQESERKFRTLFESMTEGVALHKVVYGNTGEAVDYRILEVNPAYEMQTGLPPERTRGVLASELYGTGAPPYLAEYDQVAQSGEPLVFETYFPPMKKHFRISAVSSKTGQFATVFEDITERIRREEELRRKTAELERFTYAVSHDLKSPLVTVKSFLGYLEQDLARPDAGWIVKDMQYIRAAADKMGQLLDELLEMSRVGRVVHPPVRVPLRELVGEALSMVAGTISERRVEVRVGDEEALELCGDRPRLVEIWQNLVENAVKYMGDQASPRIEIGTERRGRDTVFFVRDNGMGIDPRYQAKVFGMFEKLDPGSEGTGLGLALVQRIVELYQGTIWLESKGAGQGACFRFTLPDAVMEQAKGVTS